MGIPKVSQTVLARLIESQIWHPPAGSMGEELRKADSGLCPPFFLGKTVPPTSTLIPDISFPVPAAFQASVRVLEFRVSESE